MKKSKEKREQEKNTIRGILVLIAIVIAMIVICKALFYTVPSYEVTTFEVDQYISQGKSK